MEPVIPYVTQRKTALSAPNGQAPVKGSKQGKLRVLLATVGNIDRHENSMTHLPGMKPYLIGVTSLLEAREKCLEFINVTGIGGGNWAGETCGIRTEKSWPASPIMADCGNQSRAIH